ncbi:MAG: phosphoribosylglycinamide formyltransferase [Candidatus Thermoplasmatota archaeon]|nr:phosphoribosylglycinamide formyltransferase [Candidatus Thermoplasmatota archaeon]
MTITLGILASGRGSNFKAIADNIKKNRIDAKIEILITDNPSAGVLHIANMYGIKAICIEKTEGMKRDEHESIIDAELRKYEVELIVLAGYMRILTPSFIEKWRWRIINTHPSLLPAFGGKGMYGMNVHRAVIESGTKYSGCTVHFVTENTDMGQIIAQNVIKVKDNDTVDSLEKRILKKEHELLPKVIDLIGKGKVTINNNRVHIEK